MVKLILKILIAYMFVQCLYFSQNESLESYLGDLFRKNIFGNENDESSVVDLDSVKGNN